MNINKKYKNIDRYKEISRILAKYGFSILADKLDDSSVINSLFLKKSKNLSNKYSRAERVKMALEELGPTFVKFGQILSTRYDILPKDIVEQLSNLQDKVKTFEYNIAKQIFETQNDVKIENVFRSFNKKPIAAASIGQVYKGVLKDGKDVVIKIQRPNIRIIIEKDLDILYSIASLLDAHFEKKIPIKYVNVVNEFSYFIKKELDYTYEAQNYDNFRNKFKDNDSVVIPKVYWDYSTKKVLVTQELKGIKVNNIREIENKDIDKQKLANIGCNMFLEQIFIHGYFHGDPHPGNILIIDKDKIGLIDFGLVGYLDNNVMTFLKDLLKSIVRKDTNKIIRSLRRINAINSDTDEMLFKRDLNYVLNYYCNIPIDKINFNEALNEFLLISYKNKVKIPSQLILLVKATMTIEGTGKKLDPKFSLSKTSKDLLKKIKKEKFKPNNLIDEVVWKTTDIFEGLKNLQWIIRRVFTKIEKNKFKITFRLEGFKELEKEINIMTNKISLSLIVSSIIVGSSIIIQSKTGPTLLGMPALGFIGFIAAGILGLFLIVSILLNMWNNRK